MVVVAIIAYARPTTSCIPKGAEVRLSDKVVGVATLNARNAINKHMVSIAKTRGLVNGPGLRQRHCSTKFSIKLLLWLAPGTGLRVWFWLLGPRSAARAPAHIADVRAGGACRRALRNP